MVAFGRAVLLVVVCCALFCELSTAALNPCTGTFVDTFPYYNDTIDLLPPEFGFQNTYFRHVNVNFPPLNLVLTTSGCSAACGGKPISGGAWNSAQYIYSYGTYTFIAQPTALAGTGLILGLADVTGSSEQATFTLGGPSNQVNVSTFHLMYNVNSAFVINNFNSAGGFHNYTIYYLPASVSFFVDGVLYYVERANIPSPPLRFIIYYAAEPLWYGPYDYVNPTTAVVQQVTYTVYPNASLCSTTTGNSGSTSTGNTATVTTTGGSGCSGSYINTFISLDTSLDSIQDKWNNGFALVFYPNAWISNGLSLSVSNVNCPQGCGGFGYTASGWNSVDFFSYGTFNFVAKSTAVSGTSFTLAAASTASGNLEQVAFILPGNATRTAQLGMWRSGFFVANATVALPFDASTAYHNYTIIYNPNIVMFYADGVKLGNFTGSGISVGPLQINAIYTALPSNYGPLNYPGLTFTYVSQVSYAIYCEPPTTSAAATTSAASTTAAAATTGAATTAAVASSTIGHTTTASATTVAATTAHSTTAAVTTAAVTTTAAATTAKPATTTGAAAATTSKPTTTGSAPTTTAAAATTAKPTTTGAAATTDAASSSTSGATVCTASTTATTQEATSGTAASTTAATGEATATTAATTAATVATGTTASTGATVATSATAATTGTGATGATSATTKETASITTATGATAATGATTGTGPATSTAAKGTTSTSGNSTSATTCTSATTVTTGKGGTTAGTTGLSGANNFAIIPLFVVVMISVIVVVIF